MSLLLLLSGVPAVPVWDRPIPEKLCGIAFASTPSDLAPTYVDVSDRVRDRTIQRGRSFEFDRFEAGTSSYLLDNRDSELNPENTGSAWFPIKPTRRVRHQHRWDGVTYDAFHGYTKGFPQDYPHVGYDAVVKQSASDAFFRLNMAKFVPGSTLLNGAVSTTPVAGTEETWTVDTTGLPLPQVVPFTLMVDAEQVTVLGLPTATTYRLARGANGIIQTHADNATVQASTVEFAEALSGTRIAEVLAFFGITGALIDLEDGQSRITATGDITGGNPLEHIQLVAEAERGRFFIAKDDRATFHDRHHLIEVETISRGTFGFAPGEIPYMLDGEVAHDESHLYNIVRITIPSGYVADARLTQAEIDEDLEREYVKTWPLASEPDADAAASALLEALSTVKLRVPQLTVYGVSDPATLWPLLLGMEIGQRWSFVYPPRGGGDPIEREMIVDGIGIDEVPAEHITRLQLTPIDVPGDYWRIGVDLMGATTTIAP